MVWGDLLSVTIFFSSNVVENVLKLPVALCSVCKNLSSAFDFMMSHGLPLAAKMS